MALAPEPTLNTTSGAASITQVWGLTSTDHPCFWFSVNGIWYDALTTLAKLRLVQPEDRAIAQDWTWISGFRWAHLGNHIYGAECDRPI